ncbi:MAG: peptidoglycan-binding domain-containing protein [Solirubrobacterales bacterium]
MVTAFAIAATAIALAAPASSNAAVSPFNQQGMWVWYIKQAEQGSVDKIIARAKRYKVKTLFVKSADGSSYWPQFELSVGRLKAAGLRVCAWQYVYGRDPEVEADLAAKAAGLGADCLVINAETEYKNKYTAAQTYISRLRSLVGADFPVGLTSFAYPDYHSTFPYSVFLGPGGAQWNLPQMYFKAFRQSVPTAFARTYSINQIYKRSIRPLGQTYDGVRAKQVIEFRRYARLYRARGYSWWSWQHTRTDAWKAMRRKFRPSRARAAAPAFPVLKQGGRGDLVRWAQLHIVAAGIVTPIDSNYNAAMTAAVQAFQTQRGLPVTGAVDQLTWPVLLSVQLPSPAA